MPTCDSVGVAVESGSLVATLQFLYRGSGGKCGRRATATEYHQAGYQGAPKQHFHKRYTFLLW